MYFVSPTVWVEKNYKVMNLLKSMNEPSRDEMLIKLDQEVLKEILTMIPKYKLNHPSIFVLYKQLFQILHNQNKTYW